MGLLTPSGITITPQRDTGSNGNPNWVNQTPIDNAVFALEAPSEIASEAGTVYTQSGSVFVPRGSDLQDGDRIPHLSKRFRVIGDALWDMNQPFTGSDFGYVEYKIRMGG